MSKPKVPSYSPPAAKPERVEDVQPEEVQMGDQSTDSSQKKGKRALMRPSGAGTGLSV